MMHRKCIARASRAYVQELGAVDDAVGVVVEELPKAVHQLRRQRRRSAGLRAAPIFSEMGFVGLWIWEGWGSGVWGIGRLGGWRVGGFGMLGVGGLGCWGVGAWQWS